MKGNLLVRYVALFTAAVHFIGYARRGDTLAATQAVFWLTMALANFGRPKQSACEMSGRPYVGAMLADLAERRASRGDLWYWNQLLLSFPAIAWSTLTHIWCAMSRRRGA